MDLIELFRLDGSRHPWEISRAGAIERLVRLHGPSAPNDMLDFGCGDGFTGRHLRQRFGSPRYLGFDTHLSPEQCSAWASPEQGLSFTNREPPADARFDVVLMCDVIEHVEDPLALLRAGWSRTRAGGILVVTVPAFQALFCRHDRALRHFRRYSLAELVETLERAQLPVGPSGYLFGSLLLPRALTVAREKLGLVPSLKKESEIGIGRWNGGPLLTQAITTLLNLDNGAMSWLSHAGIKLPGLTAWATLHNNRTDRV